MPPISYSPVQGAYLNTQGTQQELNQQYNATLTAAKTNAFRLSAEREARINNWLNIYNSNLLNTLNAATTRDPLNRRDGLSLETRFMKMGEKADELAKQAEAMAPEYTKALADLEGDVNDLHNRGAGARYEAQLAMARGAATSAAAQYGNIGSAAAQAVQAGAQGVAMQDAFRREGDLEREIQLARIEGRRGLVDAYAKREGLRQTAAELGLRALDFRLRQHEVAQQIRISNISSAIAAFSAITQVRPVNTNLG